ncbi:phosphatidylinositol-specific phospholipase C/glycerophosphodiester phosphodiesterase family protein [Tunicatimonas pelagia]|uniref:phosphatidylinositol-specific phospholipase C/glycerophosphodiester phosphodiesterase family protein n=1 Tax=Tunicatimonas pelagia TaxID=931531 RepID=UPI002666BDD5|nr:phosphatidylinositol-specific phospholipase C/glycerophosphodiester phosphodiesterase family protein [Tunicatimonas pelagia]WKN42196.1 phosphatidylinositol-specific phospholipase C/glycerophosphodiester phosphodiesterase family protein [Tunicatimonas pelagia]
MPTLKLLWLLSLIFSINLVGWAQVTPLPNAHAHNDYQHERPLLDALAHGFTSVEADILLIDGKLYVGHDRPEGSHSLPTLEEAYLEPLQQRVTQQNGKVYAGYNGDFYLMLDFKTEAKSTYNRLKEVLHPYQDMLSYTENDTYHPGAVTIFLSGNRPIEQVRQEPLRWVSIDGRPADLAQGYSAEFMPVISQHYRAVIDWDGKEPLSRKQLKKLRKITRTAHQEGKKVRLWATPENALVWKTLLEAEVDLINTDKLAELQQFLNQQNR